MEVTQKIKSKIDSKIITKLELSEMLGISRVTLNTRLDKSNWKKSELYLLRKIA